CRCPCYETWTIGTHALTVDDVLPSSVADAPVGSLVKAGAEAHLLDRTTFLVTADHSFATVDYNLNLAHVFKEEGLLDHLNFRGSGWTLFIELGDSFNASAHQAALERALDKVLSVDGVYRVVRPEQDRKSTRL